MFIHDVLKIQYINMGYLPGYPYHLISDAEMFEAFLKDGGVFNDFYPCPEDSMQEAYDALRQGIENAINAYLESGTEIPNWVYSYMLRIPITYQSDEVDIAYLCELGNIDVPTTVAEFNEEVAEMCLDVSTKWILKQPSKYKDRPPTMFGEAHVIKSLRLDQSNILSD